MAVAVTGSAGFIGTAVVAALVDAGHDVIGIDRRPARSRHGRYTHLAADLSRIDDLVRVALATAEAVIHLAGCPGVRDARPDADGHRLRDNVLATQAVLAEVPPGTPLVVTSSSAVYGGSRGGRRCAETDPPAPRGGYARSKRAVERLCEQRLAAGGCVTVARPFTVAGEGQRPDMALAQWIAAAREGRPLTILGSPDRSRDVTDVRQVARALVTLAQHMACGVVNIGTGVSHRLWDLVAVVADLLGTEVATRVVSAHPDEVTDTLADTTRLRRLVGFVPETDLRDVVARQLAAATVPVPARG